MINLEQRICKCGCGASFKVLPTSKQLHSSEFCIDTTKWLKGSSWKKSKNKALELKVSKPPEDDDNDDNEF